MKRGAARFWNAIVIAGMAVTGCHRDLPVGGEEPDLVVDDLAFVFPVTDLTVPPDMVCTPDLGLVGSTDGFDPRNGCLPGEMYEDGGLCLTGDPCGNCLPCFI